MQTGSAGSGRGSTTRKPPPLNREVLVNGVVFLVAGLASLVEARRLSLDPNAGLLSQRLGPGVYIYILGTALLVIGVLHIVSDLRMPADVSWGGVALRRVLVVTLAMAAYTLLIERVGYVLATFAFFLIAYWLFGVRRWWVDVPVSLVSAAAFYLLFIRLFEVIFPAGTWFDPFV